MFKLYSCIWVFSYIPGKCSGSAINKSCYHLFGFKKFVGRKMSRMANFPLEFMFGSLVEVYTLKSSLTRTLLLGRPGE